MRGGAGASRSVGGHGAGGGRRRLASAARAAVVVFRTVLETVAEVEVAELADGQSLRQHVGAEGDVRLDLLGGERGLPHAHFVVARLRVGVTPGAAAKVEGALRDPGKAPRADGIPCGTEERAVRPVDARVDRGVAVPVGRDGNGDMALLVHRERLGRDVLVAVAFPAAGGRRLDGPDDRLTAAAVVGHVQGVLLVVALVDAKAEYGAPLDALAQRRPQLDGKRRIAERRRDDVVAELDPRPVHAAAVCEADLGVVVDIGHVVLVRAHERGVLAADGAGVGEAAVEAPAVEQLLVRGNCASGRERRKCLSVELRLLRGDCAVEEAHVLEREIVVAREIGVSRKHPAMRGRKLEAVGIEERGRADGGVYVSDRLAVPVQRDRAALQEVGRRALHVYGDEGMKRIRRVAQSVQLDARGNVLAAAVILENRHVELSGTGRGRHDELLR